jgi:Holliday junction DNA helicase RuvB
LIEDMSEPLAERMRPRTLDQYVGQKHLVGQGAVLRKMIDAGRISSFILWGPPGVGKTTLAQIIANKLETPFYTLSAVTSGVKDVREVIERAKNNRFFNSNSPILFIDEIHRLRRVVEEILYSAMEDYKIDILIESGPAARSVQLNLKPFTLIGATTRSGMLTAPLRARFGINCRLQYYDAETLAKIVNRSAGLLQVKITSESAFEIARRSRGTPRIANLLLRRVRDFAQVKGDGTITLDIARYALQALNVDRNGLDDMDIRILTTIIDKFKGGPVGINTIATAVGEDAGTVEEVYEPYLIQEGYLMRTPRGREATMLAYQHLGKLKTNGNQQELF